MKDLDEGKYISTFLRLNRRHWRFYWMLRILRIGICAVGLSALGTTISAQTGTQDGFELVKDEDSILVYERWVTFPHSQPPTTAREVKSEFYIRGNIEDALALLQDEKRIFSWQKHVAEFKVYPRTDSLWYEYSYHDIPWPVSDQDHFLEYRIRNPEGADGLFITFHTVQNKKLAPVRKGVDRMTLAGSWYLQEIPGGRIKATYRILSMPGTMPRFITDPVIRNNLMSTVRSFITILEEGYHAEIQ